MSSHAKLQPSWSLTVSDVIKKYKSSPFLLNVSNLKLCPASQTALVGKSGSGKSTLLNLISGQLNSEQGHIIYKSKNIFNGGAHPLEIKFNQSRDSELRRFRFQQMGLVYQDHELIPWLSLEKNILFPYLMKRKKGIGFHLNQNEHEKLQSLLEKSGLSHLNRQKSGTLSQGERQRTTLCRALMMQPAILLADEPTANLDRESAAIIRAMLMEYCSSQGALLVVATHDPEFISQLPDKIEFKNGVLI